MISFLVGVIEEKRENLLLLDVNGVGFELAVSSNTLSSLPMQGASVKVLTYMAVREDDISLYGFSSQEEKDLFNKLITIRISFLTQYLSLYSCFYIILLIRIIRIKLN